MWYEKLALIIVAIGAINLGLAELGYDLVYLIFGSWSVVATIIYYVIAVLGLYALYLAIRY